MSTTYILLSKEEVVNLSLGEEIPCSLDEKEFAIMLEGAYKEKYLGVKEDANG